MYQHENPNVHPDFDTATFSPMALTSLKPYKLSVLIACLGFLVLTPLPAFSHGKGMYDTKAEAEKRAREIGCEGVHENNGRWMPCLDEADLHRALRRQ